MKDFVTSFIVLLLGIAFVALTVLQSYTNRLYQEAQQTIKKKDEEILHLNARIADLLDAVQDRDKTIKSWQMLTIEIPVEEIGAPAPPAKRTPRKATNKNNVVEE